MKTKTLNYTHLQLGLTRSELQRRLETGEIDIQLLQKHLDHNSEEIKLEALTEAWLQQKSLDQVDKFKTTA